MSKTDTLKLISLGGAGEVTRNLFAYQYQDKILIVDVGVGFPETTVYGIDYLLPDISYLKKNLSKYRIVGILLTHGHEDHIGALPYLYQDLGSPMIYGSRLALGLLAVKFKEFNIKLKTQYLKPTQSLTLGPFRIEPVAVTHSIPDTYHYFIQTPVGTIYHGTDFKFDQYPVIGPASDKQRIKQLAKKYKVLLMLSDSLRVDRPGRTPSEKEIEKRFEAEIQATQGRFFLTTFSSNLARFQQAINASLKHNRYIVPVGRSIETAFQVALELKYLKLPSWRRLDPQAAMDYPPDQLTYLIGGSQGQVDSSLRRVAEGTHPYVRADAGDTVIFSSDPIPGNEVNVYTVIDLLTKRKVKVLYPDIADELYVSGHASCDELVELAELVKPRFLMPIGGQYRHLSTYAQVMQARLGYQETDIIIPENGQFVELKPGSYRLGRRLRLKDVIVDGKGIGDVGTLVLEERRVMARAGVVFVVFPVKAGRTQSPAVYSQGFVFKPYYGELFDKVRQNLTAFTGRVVNDDFKRQVKRRLERFFYKQTKREPLVVVETLSLDKPRTIG